MKSPTTVSEEVLLSRLRRLLSPARLRHTLSVARLAEELALLHGASPKKARWAGFLHDCAKEMPASRQLDVVRRHRLPVPGLDFIVKTGAFDLLHAPVSAFLAARDFGVRDRRVLSAIRAHTLGAREMSLLDRILYVADFSAPDRHFFTSDRVRRLARKDLEGAFREAMRWTLLHVIETGKPLHPLTVRLWNGFRP